MKRILFFSISIVLAGCGQPTQTTKISEKETIDSVDEAIAMKKNEGKENKHDASFDYPPKSVDQLKPFLMEFVDEDKVDIFTKAVEKYDTITTDTVLAYFYLNDIKSMIGALNEAMSKSHPNTDDQSKIASDWFWISNFFPYIKPQWPCSECESEAFIYTPALQEKAKTTEGTIDDLFFDALYAYYGPIAFTYDIVGNANAGCDYCGYCTLGNGDYTNVLRKTINVEHHTHIFDTELGGLVKIIMDIDDNSIFGQSKKNVLNEIEVILEMQDSTHFDLSNLKKLRRRIKDPLEKIVFECSYDDFMSK